jgi:hypothetical protein
MLASSAECAFLVMRMKTCLGVKHCSHDENRFRVYGCISKSVLGTLAAMRLKPLLIYHINQA